MRVRHLHAEPRGLPTDITDGSHGPAMLAAAARRAYRPGAAGTCDDGRRRRTATAATPSATRTPAVAPIGSHGTYRPEDGDSASGEPSAEVRGLGDGEGGAAIPAIATFRPGVRTMSVPFVTSAFTV